MRIQKKCYRKIKFDSQEKLVEVPCKKHKKRRCESGVLRYDDKTTGRKKGTPCKDDARYKR